MSTLPHAWFGGLTSRWPVVPIRTVASLGTGHTPSRNVQEYWENCNIPWVTVEDIRREGEWAMTPLMETEQHINELGLANSAAVLHPTGTVMLSRTASIGLSCIIGRPMATTQAFVTWTPQDGVLCGRYLLAALKAMEQQFEYLAYGATHLTIYFPDINTLRVPLPPLQMQRAIASFLERETAKIDALVAEQERLIELLQEKRRAVISRVVAKELYPHAPVKPSGIEWLGDVREAWRVARVGYYATVENGSTPSRDEPSYWDGTVPWIASGEVNQERITEATEFITEAALSRCSLRVLPRGTVLVGLVGQGRTRGMAAVLTIEAAINQNLAAVVPGVHLDSTYLLYCFQSMYESIREHGRGGNQAALNCEILRALRVPIPPMEDQIRIVQFVRDAVDSIDALIADSETAVTLLRERRSALVSAAVIGQIDVRVLVSPEAA